MSYGGILGQIPDLKTLNSQVVITGNQQNILKVENTAGAADIDFQAQSATGSITLNTNNNFNISRPITIAGNIYSTGNFIGTGGNNGAAQVTYNNSATSATITSNTVQGAIDQLFTSVSNGKELIADAITDKGGSVSGSASFEELAGAIGEIQVGIPIKNYKSLSVPSLTWKPLWDQFGPNIPLTTKFIILMLCSGYIVLIILTKETNFSEQVIYPTADEDWAFHCRGVSNNEYIKLEYYISGRYWPNEVECGIYYE